MDDADICEIKVFEKAVCDSAAGLKAFVGGEMPPASEIDLAKF